MQKDVSLKPFNTFGIDVRSALFSSFSSIEELIDLLPAIRNTATLISGGGSNMLFTKDFDGLFVRNCIKGIKEIERTETHVILEAGAGENWHDFVISCVHQGFGGLENLSLIPGTVGAASIQNIGAYGVEAKDSIAVVTAYDTQSAQFITLQNSDCAFAYRTSLFKKDKTRYIISSVQFVLQKQPLFRTEYGAIKEVLHQKNNKQPSLAAISSAVIQIRSEKLPDPKKLGNAGSFFKNPTITKDLYEVLVAKYPKIIAYPITDDTYKIAAGWLIEACGWKGIQKGSVGCYEKQSLVIVHYNNGPGMEIFDFSEEIIQSVLAKFEILLEREVVIY
jgi:UDP-N-acetylmuramate dehydrogenase